MRLRSALILAIVQAPLGIEVTAAMASAMSSVVPCGDDAEHFEAKATTFLLQVYSTVTQKARQTTSRQFQGLVAQPAETILGQNLTRLQAEGDIERKSSVQHELVISNTTEVRTLPVLLDYSKTDTAASPKKSFQKARHMSDASLPLPTISNPWAFVLPMGKPNHDFAETALESSRIVNPKPSAVFKFPSTVDAAVPLNRTQRAESRVEAQAHRTLKHSLPLISLVTNVLSYDWMMTGTRGLPNGFKCVIVPLLLIVAVMLFVSTRLCIHRGKDIARSDEEILAEVYKSACSKRCDIGFVTGPALMG